MPKRNDWAWLAGLVLIGCLVGLLSNALNPRGINLRIAFGFSSTEQAP